MHGRRGRRSQLRIVVGRLGVAGFRDRVGRLTDREEKGKVVLQLDGCFLSTGIVGALTYRPEKGKG